MRRLIAITIGRALTWNTGNSNTMPRWSQKPVRWWQKITRWHALICAQCQCDIMKLPNFPRWGAKMGVIDGLILCPPCYDQTNDQA